MKSLDGAGSVSFLPHSVVSICLSTILISQEIKSKCKIGEGGGEREKGRDLSQNEHHMSCPVPCLPLFFISSFFWQIMLCVSIVFCFPLSFEEVKTPYLTQQSGHAEGEL